MADKPGASKNLHTVSRHTIVMRKMRDDDARRVAERDDGDVVHQDPSNSSARLTARGAVTRTDLRSSGRGNVSGRQVTVEQGGSISGRYKTKLSGRQAASVRVAGGDTIIKYKSGDMVIRRGTRRTLLRRQILWVYAFGYLLIFGSFMYWLLTGATTVAPEEFVEKAFSRRQSADVIDLERAALEVMRGNRTPAEIRMAQTLSFYDENKDPVRVEKGARLTLLTAAKLGRAILDDLKREPSSRTFQEPLRIYKDTQIANINWPQIMSLYNALGFFLLLGLFLWRPVMHYLGTNGKKTAVALRNARDAAETASEYRDKYRALAGELEEKGETAGEEVRERMAKEKEHAVYAARRQAEEITGGIEDALLREVSAQRGKIGAAAALAACEQARVILRGRLGPNEHDAAIEELIADIAALDSSGVKAEG